ncbi:YdcF family protein [Candidatus Burkholderia verschuerenii]|nr:YdcF family protein [Candidatus Burkholderia verschuerenii]
MRDAPADIAVVLGNALNRNGTPSPILASRLNVALRCYRERRCPVLFVSGSIDGPGLNEALGMRAWLMDRGVADRDIVIDDQGDNTLASARNATAYMRAHGMTRVMLITQYYHLARTRLAFERARAPIVTGDYPRQFRAMDLYSSWREVPAYAVYWIRLTLDADAQPVTFRPIRFLMNLLLDAK